MAFYAPLLICHKIDTYGIKNYLDNSEGVEVGEKKKKKKDKDFMQRNLKEL